VVRPGAPPAVKMIDLGDTEKIDRLISVTRLALVRGENLAAASALREVVFDRAAAFAGCERLVIALDGELVHVPLAALPTPDGRSLFDTYQLIGITSGRDLLEPTRPTEPTGSPIVAGEPDFEFDLQAAERPEPPRLSFVGRTIAVIRSLFGRRPTPEPVPTKPEPSDPQR